MKTEGTEVFLVGTKESPKTNQWLAMTNSLQERDRLLRELEGAETHKSIVVRARGNRR